MVRGWIDNWFGGLVLFGFTLFLCFHALNGVRHLVWDLGHGLDKDAAHRSGLVVVGGRRALTLLTWARHPAGRLRGRGMSAVGRSLTARMRRRARPGRGRALAARAADRGGAGAADLWFVVAAVGLSGAGYEEVRAWLAAPFNTTAMLLLSLALFWHAQLGAQVIIEDYVHQRGWPSWCADARQFRRHRPGPRLCASRVLKVALGS